MAIFPHAQGDRPVGACRLQIRDAAAAIPVPSPARSRRGARFLRGVGGDSRALGERPCATGGCAASAASLDDYILICLRGADTATPSVVAVAGRLHLAAFDSNVTFAIDAFRRTLVPCEKDQFRSIDRQITEGAYSFVYNSAVCFSTVSFPVPVKNCGLYI